jgi:hypothetical protein
MCIVSVMRIVCVSSMSLFINHTSSLVMMIIVIRVGISFSQIGLIMPTVEMAVTARVTIVEPSAVEKVFDRESVGRILRVMDFKKVLRAATIKAKTLGIRSNLER